MCLQEVASGSSIGKCGKTCNAEGYYKDLRTDWCVCQSCDKSCVSCTGGTASDCTDCESSKVLNPVSYSNGEYVGECVDSCDTGYAAAKEAGSDLYICLACDVSCKSCSYPQNKWSCIECQTSEE